LGSVESSAQNEGRYETVVPSSPSQRHRSGPPEAQSISKWSSPQSAQKKQLGAVPVSEILLHADGSVSRPTALDPSGFPHHEGSALLAALAALVAALAALAAPADGVMGRSRSARARCTK
jgi:hypothetical protein